MKHCIIVCRTTTSPVSAVVSGITADKAVDKADNIAVKDACSACHAKFGPATSGDRKMLPNSVQLARNCPGTISLPVKLLRLDSEAEIHSENVWSFS